MKKYSLILLFFIANGFAQSDAAHYFNQSIKFYNEENFEISKQMIVKAVEMDSLNLSYLYHQLNILTKLNNCDEGVDILQKIFDINDRKLNDQFLYFMISIYDCNQRDEKATEILKNYIDSNTFKNDEMILLLAQRLLNQEDSVNSTIYYKKYVKRNPEDVAARLDLAKLLFTFDNQIEAKETLEKGLELDPKSLPYLIHLAGYYLQIGSYEKALEYQQQVIALDNSSVRIADRAGIYELLGHSKAAYNDYLLVKQTEKCNLNYFTRILTFEFQNKMYEEVIKNSLEIIQCDSNNEKIVSDGLYTSYFFCDDYANGKFYLERKLKEIPQNYNPYYIKILTLLKEKNYDSVQNYIDLALKTTDCDDTDRSTIHLIKFGLYLINEDYQALATFIDATTFDLVNQKSNVVYSEKETKNNLGFIIDFDKTKGIIFCKLTIPSSTRELLFNKYGWRL